MNDLEIQQRLRVAVKGIPVPPDLPATIRRRVEETSQPRPMRWAQTVAAALAIAMAGAWAYQDGYLRFTPSSRASYLASLTSGLRPDMRDALCDHVLCTVFRAPESERDLGPYQDVRKALESRQPAGYRMAEAHRCTFQGREFVHVVFKSGDRLLSLVIAGRGPDDAMAAKPRIEEASAQRYQIAEDETSGYRVFVVSDLPKRENRETLMALSPAVKNALKKIRGAA